MNCNLLIVCATVLLVVLAICLIFYSKEYYYKIEELKYQKEIEKMRMQGKMNDKDVEEKVKKELNDFFQPQNSEWNKLITDKIAAQIESAVKSKLDATLTERLKTMEEQIKIISTYKDK